MPYFPNAHSVLYFPLENIIVPEVTLCIHYNKPVKVLLMLVHYGKLLYVGVVLRQILYSALPCAILASTAALAK